MLVSMAHDVFWPAYPVVPPDHYHIVSHFVTPCPSYTMPLLLLLPPLAPPPFPPSCPWTLA